MSQPADRLHALDAVRGFALTLGVFFHAAISFIPSEVPVWIIMDDSRSPFLAYLFMALHMFRMTTFFLIAGFFARLAFHRRGFWGFARDRAQRIALPLVVFWPIVMAGIIGAGLLSIVLYDIQPPEPPPPPDPAPPLLFPLTHLWFLYVLLLFYVGSLALRGLVALIDRGERLRGFADRIVAGLMAFPLAPFVLAIPVGVLFVATPGWPWNGIPTPDYSLVPNAIAAVGYGLAFGFGWLLHRQIPLLQRMERLWWLHLAIGLGASVACFALYGVEPKMAAPAFSWRTGVFAACYAVGSWSMTFAFVGLALRFFSGVSAWRRYLADASYWIYILHLPLVFAAQTLAAKLPYAWWIKYPAIVAAVMLVCLVTYHVLVRRTFVGWMLNGKRAPKRAKPGPALAAQAS